MMFLNSALPCSFEIAEQPAMQSLMQNNTSLAQKLLVGVMKHKVPKTVSKKWEGWGGEDHTLAVHASGEMKMKCHPTLLHGIICSI